MVAVPAVCVWLLFRSSGTNVQWSLQYVIVVVSKCLFIRLETCFPNTMPHLKQYIFWLLGSCKNSAVLVYRKKTDQQEPPPPPFFETVGESKAESQQQPFWLPVKFFICSSTFEVLAAKQTTWSLTWIKNLLLPPLATNYFNAKLFLDIRLSFLSLSVSWNVRSITFGSSVIHWQLKHSAKCRPGWNWCMFCHRIAFISLNCFVCLLWTCNTAKYILGVKKSPWYIHVWESN